MSDKRVLLARCGAAHGIKGEVRVKAFTDEPGGISDYGPLETEDGSRRFEVERMREADTVLVVKFIDVDDRTAAEALNGVGLYVPRTAMPDTGDEETWYRTDLIGLAAETADGKRMGDILNVVDFGAGDLLEIMPATGTSVYLAFTSAFVPVVDVAGGKVIIEPPDDLFKTVEHPEAPPKPPTRRPRDRKRTAGPVEASGGGES